MSIKKKIISGIGAVAFCAMAFFVTPVEAKKEEPKIVCVPENAMTNYLISSLGMSLYGYGINQNNSLELWVHRSKRDYLVVLRTPDGRKCLLTGGVGWVTEVTREH